VQKHTYPCRLLRIIDLRQEQITFTAQVKISRLIDENAQGREATEKRLLSILFDYNFKKATKFLLLLVRGDPANWVDWGALSTVL